jgi:Fic family protein
MKWNWQLKDWPNFTWDSDKLVLFEKSFTENAGIIIGSSQHISQEGKQNLFIDLMCTDALDSSEIEDEHLNRDSVQSSIKAEGKINPRQEKVLLRLFHEGPDGFVGGLSAKNYMSITGAPIATTTRDLNDLVKKNILKRTGEVKATRYFFKSRKDLT